jgi:hypothetical protein
MTKRYGGDEKESRKNPALKLERFRIQKSFRALDTPPVVTPAKGKSFDCIIRRGGWKGKIP